MRVKRRSYTLLFANQDIPWLSCTPNVCAINSFSDDIRNVLSAGPDGRWRHQSRSGIAQCITRNLLLIIRGHVMEILTTSHDLPEQHVRKRPSLWQWLTGD